MRIHTHLYPYKGHPGLKPYLYSVQLRSRISYIICLVFALFVVAGIVERQYNVVPVIEQSVATHDGTDQAGARDKSAASVEQDNSTSAESIHLQPQRQVPGATRVKDAAKTFLLSRYLSYLDDSFSLHTATAFIRAVAFHITAYRLLLTFPKHWFW